MFLVSSAINKKCFPTLNIPLPLLFDEDVYGPNLFVTGGLKFSETFLTVKTISIRLTELILFILIHNAIIASNKYPLSRLIDEI